MKIHVAIFIATLVSPGFTQTAERQTALELGHVTVWLGMPEQEAMRRFSNAGYKATDAGFEVILKAGTDFYSVRFKQAHLIYAERSWYEDDGVSAILGALGSLADNTKSEPCTVSRAPVREPGTTWDRIFIFCGDRSVRIGKGSVRGVTQGLDVSESIGELPPAGK